MFFRKLLGNNESKSEKSSGPPAGMQTMGANLQRRFAKGIQYNMKIIIKGDRNVGKTCVFLRLQGQKFKEEYIPTEEIQVASIMWNYKATDDIVKVEVWDIVDKGKKKKKVDALKLDNSIEGTSSDIWGEVTTPKGSLLQNPEPIRKQDKSRPEKSKVLAESTGMYDDTCLDAEFVDVYKGTQGVILVMDITKQWTFDYAQRELEKIPMNVPVLLLANHRDMGHHRTYTEDQVRVYIEELNRPEGAGQIRYAESSMRNGFGLKYIHKFFNLPFLALQRETLLKQLETNSLEIETTNEELILHEQSEDQNYDLFLDGLTNKRREQAEELAQNALDEAKHRQDLERTAALNAATQQNKTTSAPTTPVAPPTGVLREAPPAKPIPGLDMAALMAKPTVASIPVTNTVTKEISSKSAPATPTAETEKTGSLMSRLFGSKNKTKTQEVSVTIPEKKLPVTQSMHSVDDFVPEEALDASFLDDTRDVDVTKSCDQESSSEDEGNPMVAGFQDVLDSDDDKLLEQTSDNSNKQVFSADLELSSDDEVEAGKSTTVISPFGNTDFNEGSEIPGSKLKTSNSFAAESRRGPLVNDSKTQQSLTSSQNNNSSNNPAGWRSSTNDQLKPKSESSDKPLFSDLSKPQYKETDTVDDLGIADNRDVNDSEEELMDKMVVLEDTEDVSEEETGSSLLGDRQAADKQAADNTMQRNDDDLTQESQPSLGLEFQDLSVLEKGFSFTNRLPRVESAGSDLVSSSRVDSDAEQEINSSSSSKKKKKHKNKDREREKGGEHSSKKHKHKKNKEKDRALENPETDDAKLRKKKKKKKIESEECERDGDLEAFLGSPTPGDGAYESI